MLESRALECTSAALQVFLARSDFEACGSATQTLCWLCYPDVTADAETRVITDQERVLALHCALNVLGACRGHHSVCVDALKVLGHVTKYDVGRKAFVTSDGKAQIEKILDVLRSAQMLSDSNAVFATVLILCYLANVPANQVVLEQMQAIPLVVRAALRYPKLDELLLHTLLTLGLLVSVSHQTRVESVTRHKILAVVDLAIAPRPNGSPPEVLALECVSAILWQVRTRVWTCCCVCTHGVSICVYVFFSPTSACRSQNSAPLCQAIPRSNAKTLFVCV